MSTVGLVVHPARPEATDVGDRLFDSLAADGVSVRRWEGTDTEDPSARTFAMGLDLVVSIGGDGTFLRAAHLASSGDAPVLGVKVGRLGFLTEHEPSEAGDAVRRFLSGGSRVESRLAIEALARGGEGTDAVWALNEVIVEKLTRHRLVRLALLVDDDYVTTFSADGVIVATPTGSTAYSFSAGGPILAPPVDALLVTPVAAHMVFDRSLVVDAGARVRLEVVGDEPGLVSADGRSSRTLPVGAIIDIRRSERSARIVRREPETPFPALLRDRFGLPADPGRSDGVGGEG